MLNQFQAYLVQRGYKEFSISGNPSTAIDYAWRVAKVCEKKIIQRSNWLITSTPF